MNLMRWAWRIYVLVLIMACTPWSALARDDGPTMLVATPELSGGYARTVLLVAAYRGGHVGIVVNRTTRHRLSELFPDDEASRNVEHPVHFGGPVTSDALFALVQGPEPHPSAIAIGPNLWLVAEAPVIDRIIEATPNAARYFIGIVVWRPGELEAEIRQGMFVRRPVDPAKIFLPDTSTLWNELAPAPKKAGVIGT